jgi:beta-galactosidase
VKSDVAFIYDYDSLWALRLQPGFAGNSLQEAIRRYQQAFFRAGVNVDMLPPGADLSAYKLVLTPDLFVLPDDVARQLVSFVEQGGVLLADARTGVKDESGLAHERTLPGLLSPALGIEIPEYEALSAVEYAVDGGEAFPGNFTATRYADWVVPNGAEVLGAYSSWPVSEFAAVTRHAFGKGRGWYVGTVMKEQAFYDDLIARLLVDAGVEPVVRPPDGVEVSVRQNDERKLVFLINHTEQERTVPVPAGRRELLSDTLTGDVIELGRYGVAIVEM